MNTIEIREEILSWIKNAPKLNGCAIPSAGEKGVVTGLMNTALKLDSTWDESNLRRRQALAYIFRDILGKPMVSTVSAKELSDEYWWAMIKWTEATKDADTGAWKAHDGFSEQIVLCWQALLIWEKSMNQQLGFLEESDGHN